MKKFLLPLLAASSALLLQAETLTLAQKGKARAAIVIADNATPVAKYAADELVWHLKRITGAEFPTITESKFDSKAFPIYVGATRAAEEAGLGQNKFEKESWAIRSTPKALYLIGGESNIELMHHRRPDITFKEISGFWKSNGGFNRLARRGTLYSVTAFLQNICGIRWLWPGELGTLIPKNADLAIKSDLNITGAPRFSYRQWRIMGYTCMYFKPGILNTWNKTKLDPTTGKLYFSQ